MGSQGSESNDNLPAEMSPGAGLMTAGSNGDTAVLQVLVMLLARLQHARAKKDINCRAR